MYSTQPICIPVQYMVECYLALRKDMKMMHVLQARVNLVSWV